MNATVAKPADQRAISFNLPYSCLCGEGRAVLARNLSPALPISGEWRGTGPCAGCGRSGRWRIVERERDYLIQVEPPDA